MSLGFNLNLSEDFSGFSPSIPADGCTQCGICLSTCPTYAKSGDMDQSPMGRIRLMRALDTGDAEGLPLEKLESCLVCNTCANVCPSRVNYESMLAQALSKLRDNKPVPADTGLMLFLSVRPWLIKLMVQLTAIAQCLGVRWLLRRPGIIRLAGLERADQLLGNIRFPAASVQNQVNILGPARAQRLMEMINIPSPPANNRGSHRRRVSLFKGCFTSVLEQDVQQAAVDVLNSLGIEVLIPDGQTCCGALHHHNGDIDQAVELAKKNVSEFNSNNSSVIITTSSGCGSGLNKYGEWLESDGLDFSQPVMDINHYLETLLHERRVVFNSLPLKVAVHTPCSLKQQEGQADAVKALLQRIPGLVVHELSGAPACCGAGGNHMLSEPDMADALRDDIVEEVMTLQPDVLISSNLGCAMHLRAGLAQAGSSLPLLHPVQLLSRALQVKFVSINHASP